MKFNPIVVIGIFIIVYLPITFMIILMISENNNILEEEHINKICENIGLDVLSVSKQIFGESYVVCYDKETNRTRRVEI